MLDWTTCQAVERDPLKVSGAWVFRGTRVPVSALFENIEGGATVDQFVQWFPGVAREQIDAVLDIRVSLVVRPVQETRDSKPVDEHFVRVTFQRIVRRTDNSEIAETLRNPELLQGFFDKLSRSVFLEGHKI